MFWIKPPLKVKPYLHDALWNVEGDEKVIYLTFDDGPHPESTPFILEQLKQFNFTATFFCLGESAEQHSHLLDKIRIAGHSIGNHTYHHLNAWNTRATEYVNDVGKAQQLLDAKLFRPPYGRLMYSEWKQLKQDYRVVMWSLMPEDFKPELSSETIYNRLTKNLNRNLVVLHENDNSLKHLYAVLPRYLAFLKENDYEVKALADDH